MTSQGPFGLHGPPAWSDYFLIPSSIKKKKKQVTGLLGMFLNFAEYYSYLRTFKNPTTWAALGIN